ncbi:MAG: quercetin dioxygenase-like cupin family protein [Alphaproteobacteria bacterium]|jgi:quercetin dioxygenase-like cupin family protein
MQIRRIVTGHDKDGNAVVVKDEEMSNVKVMPSGNKGCVMWATESTPADANSDDDPALKERGLPPPAGGSVLRILELAPHKDAFMHRTDTVDYCIVLEGECVMHLDGDGEVAMKQGDILIQRGTWHGWENRSNAPCRLAFMLIDGTPPTKTLHETLAH